MPAETVTAALLVTLALALAARLVRALDTSGAVAGVAVGSAISVAFGLPGLLPLGALFVLGSVATRIGYRKKAERGTAERGGGARGAGRVLAKGGVAAVAALWPAHCAAAAMTGALAAALADTLGTELGSLSAREPRLPPTFRRVPVGTPGAVSAAGTGALLAGAALVAAAAVGAGLVAGRALPVLAAAGAVGALLESVLAGALPGFATLPGTLRNLITTSIGATLAGLAALGGWA